MGYASSLGIYDSTANSLLDGCSLTGAALPARRASKVSYVTRVIASLLSAAVTASRSATVASLEAAINNIINAAYSNQSIPAAAISAISDAIVTIEHDPLSPVFHADYAAMSQSVAFASTVSYSGDTQMAYDKGYGKYLGIYRTVSRRRIGYQSGTSVVGFQTVRRTGSSISWISVLECAAARSALAFAASRDLTSLQASIQQVINSEYSSLSNAAQPTSMGAPSQSGFCDSSSSGLSSGAIAGIVIGSVAGCILLLVVIYSVAGQKTSKNSEQTAYTTETVNDGVELEQSNKKTVKIHENKINEDELGDVSFKIEGKGDVSFRVDAVAEERLDGVIMGI